MSPSEFATFRDLLMPASGFQSAQFREVEFACGVREERYLKMFPEGSSEHKRIKARMKGPTLWEALCLLLKREGFPVATEKEQLDAIIKIYSNGGQNELRTLLEGMIEFDERFSLWREHHVRMAERMIGGKPGTGQELLHDTFGKSGPMGTMGVEYLKKTLGKRFFPLLWDARSYM